MAVQPFLRRLVVIRHHRKAHHRARRLGKLRKLDRLSGGVGAGTGDDRNAVPGMLDRGFNQQTVLVKINRWRLTGGTDNDDAVGAFGNLPVNQFAKCIQIQPAILIHGRDYRHQTATDPRQVIVFH